VPVYAREVVPRAAFFNSGRTQHLDRMIAMRYALPFKPMLDMLSLNSARQQLGVCPSKEQELVDAIILTANLLNGKQIDVIAAPFTDYGTAFLTRTILRALGQDPPIFYASVSENYLSQFNPQDRAKFVNYLSVQTPPEDILILANEHNRGGYFLIADLWGPTGRVTQMMRCIATRAGFTQKKTAVLKSRWGEIEIHKPDDVYGTAFSIFFPQGIHGYYETERWFPRNFELDHVGAFLGQPTTLPTRSGKGYSFSECTYLVPRFRFLPSETLVLIRRYLELLVHDTINNHDLNNH